MAPLNHNKVFPLYCVAYKVRKRMVKPRLRPARKKSSDVFSSRLAMTPITITKKSDPKNTIKSGVVRKLAGNDFAFRIL